MNAIKSQDGGYPLKGKVGVLTRREPEGFCHPGKVLLLALVIKWERELSL